MVLRGTRCRCAVWFLVPLLIAVARSPAGAQSSLDPYMDRIVTQIRADLPDLPEYEPLVVLEVRHEGGDYRVEASSLIEHRLVDAFARQRVRIVDESARRRILDRLEECYEEERGLCDVEKVIREYRPAGAWVTGRVLPAQSGVDLRVHVVAALSTSDASPGEIVG